MKAWKYDAFISYAHGDNGWVLKTLMPYLRKQRLRICLDRYNFEAGQPIGREIERAIRSSRKIILVLSPAYIKSQWTEYEHILLTALDPAGRKRRIVPLLHKHCEIPSRLSAFIYLNFCKKSELLLNFQRLSEIIAPKDNNILRRSTSRLLKMRKVSKIRKKRGKIIICQMAPFLPYLPLYIALRKGFFADFDLDVKITNGGGDHLVWDQVKKGNAHFGVADPIMMLTDRKPIGKTIGALVMNGALWGISCKSIPPIRNPIEFKWKTLATYAFPSTSCILIKSLLENAGLKIGQDVFLLEMKLGSEFDCLKNPKIDVIFVTEPLRSIAEMHAAHTVFQIQRHFDDFLFTGLFARTDYINSNQTTVQNVVSAFEKSLHFIHSEPSEAARIAASEFRGCPDFAVEIATLRLLAEKVVPKNIKILENSWCNSLQLRKAKIERMVSFNDYVDNTFAVRAIERTG